MISVIIRAVSLPTAVLHTQARVAREVRPRQKLFWDRSLCIINELENCYDHLISRIVANRTVNPSIASFFYVELMVRSVLKTNWPVHKGLSYTTDTIRFRRCK